MMVNRQGFTLIEMMVVIVISSILGGMLLTIYQQTQRSVDGINETIDVDFEDSIVYNQLEKDISGIFVPQIFIEDRTRESKTAPKQGQAKKQAKPAKPKKKLERVKDALVSVNDGKNIKSLSFITNNPLQVYGESKPRMVRVEYYLEPEDDNSRSLKLYRRESLETDMEKFREADPRSYVIADGVKQISVEFYAAGKKAKEKKDKDDKKEEEEEERREVPELFPLPEWNDDTVKENKDINEKLLPIFVKVELEFWQSVDPEDTSSRSYTFFYHIFAFDSGIVVQPKAPKQPQPPQPPRPPQGPTGSRPTGSRPGGQRPSQGGRGGQRPTQRVSTQRVSTQRGGSPMYGLGGR